MPTRGFETYERRMALLQTGGVRLLAEGLYREAEGIMTPAKSHAPVWLGTLRSSGHVRLPRVTGTTAEVTFGFGGAAGGYARVMDEGRRPGAKMPPKGSMLAWMSSKGIDPKKEFIVRRAIGRKGIRARRFFEKAVLERVPGMPERLSAFVGRGLMELWSG